ncbi:MAG TPA: cyanophycinase [Candidatus Polarisedimenticolia bacterium]|nr:cyanophycinase [Candidatus Polarisedimenticolia bacterium]
MRHKTSGWVVGSGILMGAFILMLSAAPAMAASGYASFIVGNPADVVRPTTGLWVMQGGGTDVDENFRRMGAASGGGDFVVIRVGGTDAYNQYILDLCGCDSVETIVFKNTNASTDPVVINKIRNAEALFIAGGDQSQYVKYWKNTPIEDAINFVASKPAPIGGTSAGMAIMSQFINSATGKYTLTSTMALANPFDVNLTLDKDFVALSGLQGIITDQHLIERDRIGRTLAFMARLVNDGYTTDAKAIAADRETTALMDPATNTISVIANADHPTPYVYFLRRSGPAEVCQSGVPLTYRNVTVYRISPGGTFDLNRWRGTGGISYTLTAEGGVLSSSNGSIY